MSSANWELKKTLNKTNFMVHQLINHYRLRLEVFRNEEVIFPQNFHPRLRAKLPPHPESRKDLSLRSLLELEADPLHPHWAWSCLREQWLRNPNLPVKFSILYFTLRPITIWKFCFQKRRLKRKIDWYYYLFWNVGWIVKMSLPSRNKS